MASADAGSRPNERSERSTEAGGCREASEKVRLHAGGTASRNARLKPETVQTHALSHPVASASGFAGRQRREPANHGARDSRPQSARHRRAVPGAGDSAAARADDPGPPRRKGAAASSDAGGGTRRTDHCATRNCRNQGARRRDRQPPASRAAAAVKGAVSMKIRFAAGIALIAALLAPPLAAQEPVTLPLPPQASQPPGGRKTPAPVPLKVTVVLSRFQGDKRISSMPYILGVMASGWGPGPKTTLRMGVERAGDADGVRRTATANRVRSAVTATAASAPTSIAARRSTKPSPASFSSR